MTSDDLFPGFREERCTGADTEIYCRIGGDGPPLVLLHGYPQCHATWHRVAPSLAEHFTCVLPDLRGYGQSGIPGDDPEHRNYSKRRMAEDIVAVMQGLGHRSFRLAGHDRGARVAYRLAFDHPEAVERLAIIEVVPTQVMWASFSAEMALKAYHWPFLAQPAPLPERLIGSHADDYLDHTLASWTRDRDLAVFDTRALELYRSAFRDPARLHALCEDYRAGATCDRADDEADLAAGRKIAAPLHFIWGQAGFPAKAGDPLGIWRNWAENVTGSTTDSGHFSPEEDPTGTLAGLLPFLLNA
ncbi:alpha/beta hydrolase [Pelagibius litoralis]|uniref:Alpha/beta hydrolase n=1 Tax=Pelagibius litoralis TaxID=374515 RepID=A0A967C330_9PROT|nr:alpha/beta hydrolase [Pelagibius litoralis]NIA68813.1 alpha/beta hydrolase [Pelagibius litoralis]